MKRSMIALLILFAVLSGSSACFAAERAGNMESTLTTYASSRESALIYNGRYTVTSSTLNIRRGPGTGYRVKAKLEKGDIVSRYSRKGKTYKNWVYIGYTNSKGKRRYGYVNRKYLSDFSTTSAGETKSQILLENVPCYDPMNPVVEKSREVFADSDSYLLELIGYDFENDDAYIEQVENGVVTSSYYIQRSTGRVVEQTLNEKNEVVIDYNAVLMPS